MIRTIAICQEGRYIPRHLEGEGDQTGMSSPPRFLQLLL